MIININDNQFNVKLAKTEEEKSEGMMGKKFSQNFNGMLFFMGQGKHCFWMKNCTIPLDIIFIKQGEISIIHHDCPPCEYYDDEQCERYCGKGSLVLELPGGTCNLLDISEGDRVQIIDK